ncbi:MAG: hypothetical protein QF921_11255 [Pseudomonadales bacterium]|jgi:hypothetical protein|nr:hypothetical protein [Pseudomonadales bacterium]MDP6470107.1 hypothetical protein [Pseudomonadales bacterium]MDP6827010.1 hypothetical protein [Pseudomonadales bacterium]MDP6972068.1 hypothetical protein [Pseudomonadales bacterium]|tara:strand:+ start:1457 stop:1858 length:402 start_codon:yes stop_codon:yes gene_type:complete
MEDDNARLACYDTWFASTRSGAAPPATPPEAPQPPAEQKPREADFGQEQVARRTPPSERPPQIEEIRTTITKISQRARREAIYYLANEQVWTQTNYRFVTIREGDSVTIKKARLGGYILTTEKGASTRVKRLR